MKKTIHSAEYQTLTKWLREQRETLGFTMRELGERLAVPHSYIGKVEQCERRLDLIEYLDYCKALGINPHDGIDILIKEKNLTRDRHCTQSGS